MEKRKNQVNYQAFDYCLKMRVCPVYILVSTHMATEFMSPHSSSLVSHETKIPFLKVINCSNSNSRKRPLKF